MSSTLFRASRMTGFEGLQATVTFILLQRIRFARLLKRQLGMRDLDPSACAEVLAINAIGPAMVTTHFLPALRPERKTLFAALSARIGSISDNRLGGWISYRASKASLNMLLRTLSVGQARQRRNSILAALHRGSVDTRLAGPFTRRVPKSKIFSASTAAGHLLRVIDQLTIKDSGGFYARDETRIEFQWARPCTNGWLWQARAAVMSPGVSDFWQTRSSGIPGRWTHRRSLWS